MRVLLQGGHHHNKVINILNGASLIYLPLPEDPAIWLKADDDLPIPIPTIKTEAYMSTGYIGYPLGESEPIPVWIIRNE